MTVNIPVGFMQVAYRFTLTSDPEIMITTVGVDHGGDPATTLDAMAAAFASTLSAGDVLSGWSWIGLRGLVGQGTGPPSLVENTTTLNGTGSTAGLPNNCAWLIRKNTALGGRSGKGRSYLPPFVGVEGDVDMRGVLTSAQQLGLQGLVDDWFAGFDTVLLHDSLSPVSTPTPITQFVVDRQIATQRRRMRP